MAEKRASQPESELTQLITGIIDKILRNRRFKPMPPQAALTKRQCSIAAGVGLSTIENAIREGNLDARKLGKRTLIPRAAFDRWLESLPRVPHAAADRRINVAPSDKDQRELSPDPISATVAPV